MKKLLSILLAIFVILSFAACGQNSVNEADDDETKATDKSDKDEKETTGSGDTTGDQNGDDTPESTTGGGSSNETPNGNGGGSSAEAIKSLKSVVKYDGSLIEFTWTQKDASNGIMAVSHVMTATADETASVGLTGALRVEPEIMEFTVAYTKGADGVYEATGNISAVSAKVEGEAAKGFIDLTKMGLDDSNYSQLTKRVLDGETLTAKADIEAYVMAIDAKLKIKFSVQGDKLSITSFENIYTSWGDRIPSNDTFRIADDVVRVYDEYENNKLFCSSTYRSNGIIEKMEYYSNGEVIGTTYYDENGEAKESNKDVMSPSVEIPSNDGLDNSARG
ncbi:MAG: hypothetical protein IKL40_00585 [Clostridia bacterium]|nr:hypothetical protein [Clostridia bacterium]